MEENKDKSLLKLNETLLKDYYNKLNRKINYILSIVEIEERQ